MLAPTATRAWAHELWSMGGEAVIAELGDETAERFAAAEQNAVPVLIAARDEAEDLPATLVSLSRSDWPVRPYVVDNASQDDTASIAASMGATVLKEPRPSKIRAIKTGVDAILDAKVPPVILFTDADTILGPEWAETMAKSCAEYEATGAFATGMVSFAEGHNRRTDWARNVLAGAAQYKRLLLNRPPAARGTNMAVHFTEKLHESLQELDDSFFPGADRAMRDILIRDGAAGLFVSDRAAHVVSRGDRFPNITRFVLSTLDLIPRSTFYDPAITEGMEQYVGQYKAQETDRTLLDIE